MEKVLAIVEQLQGTSGRNDKEFILKQNESNELFKKVMHFIYNPYILTGISKKKISKKLKLPKEQSTLSIIEVMDYLQSHNSGRDEDVILVQNFIQSQPENLRDFYTKIVTKDLSIGLTSSTLNKVYGDFIPEFSVMLAEKYFDHEDKINKNFIISTKMDGNRNIALVDEDVKMFTRQGQINQGFDDIEKELKMLPRGYAYDGEFIAINNDNLNSADLYRITTSIVRKDGIKENVVFHIFDMIPIEDFKKGVCNIACIDRKFNLKTALNSLNFKWIQEVPILYSGNDKTQVTYWLDKLTSDGLEGCMVNIADYPYECKRSKGLLKVKKMQTVDLEIVGFEEGEGRLSRTLGRINVMYKGNLVGVGSGYSDADRQYIWGNRNELLGRVIEVSYFEESTNKKTKEISLRFPIFKCIREEGKEISYN